MSQRLNSIHSWLNHCWFINNVIVQRIRRIIGIIIEKFFVEEATRD